MSDDSEEKTLDPTDHKLRKAREKGQVATSQDFVNASVTVSVIIYLIFAWPSMVESIDQIFRLTVDAAPLTARKGILPAYNMVLYLVGAMLLPFGVVSVFAAIAANIIHHKGIPFSMHPVTPDFSRVNPSQIFKKVFAKRNAVEFGMSLLRLTIWFVIAGVLLWFTAPQIFAATMCEGACSIDIGMRVLVILVVALIIMLLVFGLGDLPLQTSLFNHEQKMGHREMKREMKDTNGNPEFKSHRRNHHQSMVDGGTGGGGGGGKVKESIILAGPSCAVGLIYHAKDAPVPRVVTRYSAGTLRSALAKAAKAGIPVVDDPSLANDIHQSVSKDASIRERHFTRVAQHMVNKGLL
jgi:type III secretion protein U